eukprot:252926-Rhodomonas_salina.1
MGCSAGAGAGEAGPPLRHRRLLLPQPSTAPQRPTPPLLPLVSPPLCLLSQRPSTPPDVISLSLSLSLSLPLPLRALPGSVALIWRRGAVLALHAADPPRGPRHTLFRQ